MAGLIKCPVCGENNPADQEFCQFCQSRLQPLTGSIKGMDETLKPGQIPTKKNTGELEPILPQWLREARSSARQNSEDDAQAAQQPQESHPASSGGDLLAGLHTQAQDNEEEDAPDWLTSITGEIPKSKKSHPESSEVRWVELGGKDDFPQGQEEPASGTPAWLAGLNSSTPQPDEKDELTDWFRNASNTPKPQEPKQPSSVEDNSFSAPPSDDMPDWLRAIAAEHDSKSDTKPLNDSGNIVDSSSASSDTPDWLRSMAAESGAQNDDAFTNDLNNIFDATPASSDTPDWLRTMSTQDKAQSPDSAGFSETGLGEPPAGIISEAAEGSPAGAGNVPDWLKGLESETPAAASASDQDWLKGLQAGESELPTQGETAEWLKADVPAEEVEIPAWLSGAPTSEPAVPEEKQPPAVPEQDASRTAFGDVPNWLKAAAPQSYIFEEPPVEQEASAPIEPASDTLDWLNAYKSDDVPGPPQVVPAFSMDEPVEATPLAFMDDSQTSENTDALFTDMPDWLSNVDESSSSSSTPTPITNADAIAPGDLPSWVQAMRPVDSGIPQSSSSSLSSDQTLESRGALAGLQGVLPAVAGFAPTSKPKTYSIKLQASEEQQAHATLLEQILAAETEPVPLTSFFALVTSRGLRWLLAFVLFAGLMTVLILRTQIFAMPNGVLVPLEIGGALQVAQSIPDGAPVLVAFDYEPARVGEMEAAAAPMFDQMLLLRHPRLTFISTSETGANLTERFISGPLGGHGYQSGVGYLNLGYLPGGQMGIYAFAQNPRKTTEFAFARNLTANTLFDMSLAPAWTSDPWSGITSLTQFAAFIIVTDNADSARAWIEQTTSTRGTIPVVVISSAQAAPMIQPYYASRQISGLVSGLYGGAIFEQNNAGRPGTARAYWDAYSIGMLLAMVMILGGGLWNLVLGLRDRAAAREAK